MATKKLTLSILIIIAVIAAATFITSLTYHKEIKRYNFLSFGTTIQITTGLNNQELSNNTITSINRLLQTLHYKWHPWRAGDLKNLNKKLSSLKWFQINQELYNIIILTKELHKNSMGYFNPTIGKLINYWGFHQDDPNTNINTNIKTNIKTNNSVSNKKFNLHHYLKNIPTPDNIIIKKYNNNYLIKNNNPNLQLDLSGFIKADAMLKIKNILLNNNINNAMINIGGDIYIMGSKNHKQPLKYPWLIGVNQDHNIKLRVYNNETIATSGIYARSKNNTNSNIQSVIHHIIDPTTGKSAHGFYSTTVIHDNPYVADAAATALLIAGEKNYGQVAKNMNVDKFILIKNNKNHDTIISDTMLIRSR